MRFFFAENLQINQEYTLPAEVVQHLQARRVRCGERMTVFNGQGGEYRAELLSLNKKYAAVKILDFLAEESELAWPITLAAALIRSNRMDYLVEKTAELGVQSLHPLMTARCNLHLDAEREKSRVAHWQGISRSASEQCGRNRLMQIAAIETLENYVQGGQQQHCRLLLCPQATTSLAETLHEFRPDPQHGFTVLIGPEGDLTDTEKSLAQQNGFLPVSLGQRVLRAETAAVAAVATLIALIR